MLKKKKETKSINAFRKMILAEVIVAGLSLSAAVSYK